MSLQNLTMLSTACIVLSGASLLLGWYFIRVRRAITAHRNTMLSATALAALFLVFYVTRWSLYGSKPFAGTGAWRGIYFTTLVPHILSGDRAGAAGPASAQSVAAPARFRRPPPSRPHHVAGLALRGSERMVHLLPALREDVLKTTV
jgi:hypothetical protein